MLKHTAVAAAVGLALVAPVAAESTNQPGPAKTTVAAPALDSSQHGARTARVASARPNKKTGKLRKANKRHKRLAKHQARHRVKKNTSQG